LTLGLAVEAAGISKSYGGSAVLSGISVKVGAGELFAILGPSGSGKSTLLRILNILEQPDHGKVTFGGSESVLRDGKQLRRRMTMLLQRSVMFRDTVFGNVAYGLRLRAMQEREIRDRVLNALGDVGLQGFERRKALTLSGGEAQRVAFARAIAIEPDVLFLDEFTANLDPPNIKMLESALAAYRQKSGCTVVMVSHNPFQAQRLAKRCLFLYQGEVLGSGPIDDVRRLDDDRTAAFFRGDLI
jgi:tungstate transport system ATP-binding protein